MRTVTAETIGLIGRETESRALAERIDAARGGGGGALVIRGAPGIGKTSVLEDARARASTAGFEVLATTGVQSESQLPFAGLHQLLRPLLHEVGGLPSTYGKALHSAFGMSEEPVMSPHLVAMSVLHLLSECAERTPLLLLVDDAQWLDASTAGALAFVGRRLESDPIVLIVALRDGFDSPFLEAGIPELTVEVLANTHAEELLDARSPKLDRGLRDRVLRNAAGNPLALVELSTALRSAVDPDRVFRSPDLPLTLRLEHAFADRLASLPSGTRSFLRVASAEARGVLAELLTAASRLEGREITLDEVTQAKDASLVEVEGSELRFRHPLMRSAIYQSMSLRERQAAHAALASALEGDPDRRTWHQASATMGPDAQVTSDLAAIADRAFARGAAGAAMQAIERAAQMADRPEIRNIHLARAASFALIMGQPSAVLRFLDSMDEMQVPVVERPFIMTIRESYGRAAWSGASRIRELLESAERLRNEGNIDRGMTALFVIANRCWWSNPDEETRKAVVEVLNRFPTPREDPRSICILAMAGPVEHGALILDHLSRSTADPRVELDGRAVHQLGLAAHAIGDFVRAERLIEVRAQYLRAHGLLGGLTSALLKLAWTKIQLGNLKTAGMMANESERLAEETGQEDLTAAAQLASATIAAYRGEIASAERLIVAGERTLFPLEANPEQAVMQWPRGIVALANGRYEEAYQHLKKIFDPASGAYHPHVRSWVLVDLVESAAHSGHEDEASAIVRDLELVAIRTRAPLLEGALRYARPVLHPGGDDAAFQADTALTSWPFMRARLQLAHGIWLRRQRRAADSRIPLRAARDAFDALGAAPWGERARQELRATGETSRRRAHDLLDALSPQELQIAHLAATGLSNKEIGQQLFLSHRTIGSHLYRIFPKLGITARHHLSVALQSHPPASTG
jgi:DNA-binding CsgD family transcriptional regulator